MSQRVELELAGGGAIKVELDVPAGSRPVGTARGMGSASRGAGQQAAEIVHEQFSLVAQRVGAMADEIVTALAASQPDEAKLEIGLRVGADADLWLVKGDADAHLKLTLTWTKPK